MTRPGLQSVPWSKLLFLQGLPCRAIGRGEHVDEARIVSAVDSPPLDEHLRILDHRSLGLDVSRLLLLHSLKGLLLLHRDLGRTLLVRLPSSEYLIRRSPGLRPWLGLGVTRLRMGARSLAIFL